MANKKITDLADLDSGNRGGGLSSDDFLPIYDSSEVGTEKLKKEKAEKILIPQIFPYSGYSGITMTCIPLHKSIEDDRGIRYYIRVTALEVIRLIKGGDGSPIRYELSKDGVIWTSGINPKEVYLEIIDKFENVKQEEIKAEDLLL